MIGYRIVDRGFHVRIFFSDGVRFSTLKSYNNEQIMEIYRRYKNG